MAFPDALPRQESSTQIDSVSEEADRHTAYYINSADVVESEYKILAISEDVRLAVSAFAGARSESSVAGYLKALR